MHVNLCVLMLLLHRLILIMDIVRQSLPFSHKVSTFGSKKSGFPRCPYILTRHVLDDKVSLYYMIYIQCRVHLGLPLAVINSGFLLS